MPPSSGQPQGTTWDCIRQHESGGNYSWYGEVGSEGTYGAYQFKIPTWDYACQLAGIDPNDHSAANQDAAAVALQKAQGWSPWAGDGCV